MIGSAQPAMDARQSRRAYTTRREMLAFLAALFFLATLPSSLALRCKCNNEFVLSDCRFEGWTCTVPDSTGACFTRTRLYNGTVRTDYDCLLIPFNRLLCNGDRNSNTSVYECCTDGNFCNENLSPTLFPPSSDSTNSSTPTNTVTSITPSQTTSASSSPSIMVSTSSAIRPTPLSGKLRCECSGNLCQRKSSCATNYKCYRKVRYNKVADYVETQLGCMDSISAVNLGGLRACDGGLDTETEKIKCCDDGDFCNRNLSVVLNTKDPSPSVGKVASSTDTSESGGGDIYIVLSIVLVLVTMLTIVITALIVLTVFFMCYQRDKVKVFSVDHFQNRKRDLSADSPYTGKGELHPPPDTPPPDYVEHV